MKRVLMLLVGMLLLPIISVAAPKMSQDELMATIINLNGYLCARVQSARALDNDSRLVDCIKNRDGSGRVRYVINNKSGYVTLVEEY